VSQRARGLGGLPAPDAQRVPARDVENPLAEGLALLAKLQQERGLRVQVFLLPALGAPFDRYRQGALHERMREIAAATPSLPWVDLLDDFRATGANPRALTVDGLHPNPAGSAVLAEILYRKLADEQLP
jgi:lysophospholipase L1-like esterase